MPARKRKAAFVEPMLLLRADTLPEGDAWQYELKFDGYRALAIKTAKDSAPIAQRQRFLSAVSRNRQSPFVAAERIGRRR